MPIHIIDTGSQSISGDVTIQGLSSTQNLQQWKNTTGSSLTTITSAGNITIGSYTDASNYQRGIFTFLSGASASAFVIGTETSTTAGVSALSSLVSPIIIAPGYNQSLSATAPVIFQQTWGRAATVFTLLSANVTDTASNANSLLLDLRVGGSSKFQVDKNGSIYFRSNNQPADSQGGASFKTSSSGGIRASWGNGGGGWYFGGSDVNNTIVLDSGSGGRIGVNKSRVIDNVNHYADVDVWLYRDAAGTFAQRNGTASQTSRIYNTYTDANNYRRGIFTFLSGASAFVIGTETSTTAGVSALSALVSPIIIAPGYNQSLSATAPVVFQQTWGRAATVFTMLCADVIDNASSSSSRLLDLKVNGSTRFYIQKDGQFGTNGTTTINSGGNISLTSNTSIAGTFGVNASFGAYVNFGYAYAWSAGGSVYDVYLYRDGPGVLAQRNGLSAQEYRLYNSYSGSGSATEYLYTKANTGSSFTIGTSARGSGENRNIEFQTAGSTRMTITSSGNVGIGTTTPNEKLTVVGNISASGSLTLGTALAVAQGGTGGTDASTARTNLGLGTTDSPTFAALTVNGHFSAVTKSFLIDHPTKQNKKLQYGVVESDQHSVFVRGKTDQSIINLPEEWIGLVHADSVTVHLTPIGKFQGLFVVSQDNETIEVGGNDGYYNYTVYGERKDVDKLQVEI